MARSLRGRPASAPSEGSGSSLLPRREVIALVDKVLPVYIIFQLFEAVCVSS